MTTVATTVADVARFLEAFAPPALAESWDNVGLLVGNSQAKVERVMTCLTVDMVTAQEAVAKNVNLIVTHHPLPFRPLARITADKPEGTILLLLIGAGVAVYSPHTGFDSAREGINQQLAEGLGLMDIRPLVPAETGDLGAGRYGRFPEPVRLQELVEATKSFLEIENAQAVGVLDSQVATVGVACGSAGDFLGAAKKAGCQALVTGEVRFHTCLEAEALGVGLVLAGHYASERFGVERLAERLAQEFPKLQVWASASERDPVQWV